MKNPDPVMRAKLKFKTHLQNTGFDFFSRFGGEKNDFIFRIKEIESLQNMLALHMHKLLNHLHRKGNILKSHGTVQ
jgi:hypothetical protein